MGVSEYSLRILCREIIKKYKDYSIEKIPIEENIKDIKIILQTRKEYPSTINDLKQVEFVIRHDRIYTTPQSLMLGNKYEENAYNFIFKDDIFELSNESPKSVAKKKDTSSKEFSFTTSYSLLKINYQ